MCNCPECGSDNVLVKTDEEQLRSFYHCYNCGKEWSRAGINRKGENTPKAKNPYTVPVICLAGIFMMLGLAFSGGNSAEASEQAPVAQIENVEEPSQDDVFTGTTAAPETPKNTISGSNSAQEQQEEAEERAQKSEPEVDLFTLEMVPEYSGNAYADINDDVPFFSEDELTAEPFQEYWPLDELGRCTGAYACIGPESLPTEPREDISSVEPTGWHSDKYDGIDGGNLYNRCHLIGYQLTGKSVNENNLITGTRYMNVEGMLPFENSVQTYVDGTGNHVLYRVRPYYEGDNLIAAGVLMEAKSIEDPLVQFCAFCYNVQPGIDIDYATGDSKAKETTESNEILPIVSNTESVDGESPTRSIEDEAPIDEEEEETSSEESEEITYVLNTNTKKFHYPYCSSVKDIKDKNKKETTQNRDELINQGYDPCKRCNP